MAKIILTDEILDRACENISEAIQTDLLAAVIAELKKRKEDDIPRPEYLKKIVIKNPDGNSNQKRS